MPRGLVIAVEGIDRSGKSTQIARLQERLAAAGRPCRIFRFPARTSPTGTLLDAHLKGTLHIHSDQATHLVFTANRWENRAEMAQLVDQGTSLVLDRYSVSGIVYSMAKGLPGDWCCTVEAGLLVPDCTVFLDISPEAAASRSGYGEEKFESLGFQKKVYRAYLDLLGSPAACSPSITRIDAARSIDEVADAIWATIGDLFERQSKALPAAGNEP